VSLAACAQAPSRASDGTASEATIAAHVAAATKAAGGDLGELLSLCKPAPASRESQSEMDKGLLALINKPAPPPGKAFDNLYFVGADWVSAWAIRTSDGIILIDALNNQMEAAALIEGGMARLGLDPRQIKYIVVTHGHGDHYGGARYLVGKYQARVIASEADWNMMHGQLEFDSAVWGRPPARDVTVRDGDKLTLGDTTLTFQVTTGHTLGTLSPTFDVREGGRTHHAVLWGGTAFNFGKEFSRLKSYSANTQRLRTLTAQTGIDVFLSNHSEWDGSIEKMNRLRAGTAPGNHPFVVGTPTVDRALQVMDECARAQSGRFGFP
jgi:metallo-beta-lactamase class B